MILDLAVVVTADLLPGLDPIQVIGADQKRRSKPIAAALDNPVKHVGQNCRALRDPVAHKFP